MELLRCFMGRLRSYGSQPCIEWNGITHTYAELCQEVQLWHSRFDGLNVEPGTVVGLRADHSARAFAAILALWKLRAIAALIPRDRDATGYLGDARAAACLYLEGGEGYEWRSLGASSHPLIEQLRTEGVGGLILFTSGSTGRPKAALQSTERFLYKFRRPGRPFRSLAFLMFDHVAGMDTSFYTLGSGGTLITTRRRDPKSILSLIESHKVEVLPTSPSFLRMLCATAEVSYFDLSSLKIITYGSEPMDPSTLSRVNDLFPDAQIIQKYGTTETGSPKTVSRGNDSLWIKMKADGVETKVIDDVLWIRSRSVILGYLNADSPLDESGWYCTGDQVEMDGEWMRFRGRVVDSISVGGEKVAPTEVEQTILELDFVRDVVVRGDAHTLLGQIVVAQVALRPGALDAKAAARRIREHCRRRLALYKLPVSIEFADECTLSVRQKIQRKRAWD
jgi:long-chain acyl-CoA synthetase